jgi:hypothetical protein
MIQTSAFFGVQKHRDSFILRKRQRLLMSKNAENVLTQRYKAAMSPSDHGHVRYNREGNPRTFRVKMQELEKQLN